uniref:Uncharacterized protein n=1 Tax=Kalanchoe fedtschenkoi TaxID=63787 RepID=A0A7N1A487_KALFE
MQAPAPIFIPANQPTAEAPVVGINPMYIVPYPTDLIISEKLLSLSECSLAITDSYGNLMFNIETKFFSLRDRRVLLSPDGRPIVTFQQKILTAHRRWQVFRGESTNPKDLLFSVKKSSVLQLSTKLDVFLASNTKETKCDFRMSGSWFQRSCTITLGDTNMVIAQVHKKHDIASIILDKDKFVLTVYPFVDYTFMITLVAILQEINADRNGED